MAKKQLDAFKQRGATLVAVSPQTPDASPPRREKVIVFPSAVGCL